MVDRSQLAHATAQNEAAYNLVGLLSPSIGGVLYKNISAAFPFVFDAISYAASVVSLSFINIKFQTERTASTASLAASIREGLAWLWARPLIRTMAFVTSGINLTGAGGNLAVLVLARQRGADAQTVGFMFSLAAAGGVVGALIAGPLARRLSFAQGVLSPIWLGALLFPLLLVMPNAFAIGGVLAATFVAAPLYNVVQLSYRLSLIPDDLQGRVNSVFRMIAFSAQPLGAALVGGLLERLGVTVTFVALSAVQLAIAVIATSNRHIRHAGPARAPG